MKSTKVCVSIILFVWFLIAMMAITTFSAHAQSLVVATGSPGNTYSTMFKELASECGSSIQLTEKTTSGSNENVDLLVGNKVNGAIVQTDVMFYRARTEDLSSIKTLIALHPEEVHFVASAVPKFVGGVLGIGGKETTLSQVSELAGKKVGAAGGSVVTAQLVRLQGEVPYTVTEYPSNKKAIEALAADKIDAVVLVGGQPLSDVANLGTTYKLLSINDNLINKLKGVYRPAHLNYRTLGAAGIQTVATDALFVTRDYKSPKYVSGLKALRSCFATNLTDLQESIGKHPKWQQVKADNQGKWPYLDLK